jgi:hypothetical protein
METISSQKVGLGTGPPVNQLSHSGIHTWPVELSGSLHSDRTQMLGFGGGLQEFRWDEFDRKILDRKMMAI